MPRFKSFRAAEPTEEPLEFELAGVTFHCFAQAPARAAIALATLQQNAAPTVAAAAYITECLLSDGDAVAFDDLLKRRDVLITGRELGDVVEWLAEQYAARPTTPLSASASGLPTDGGVSTGSSSEAASESRN